MAAAHISDKDFKEKALKSKLPVLVDFFAEWCGPCKMAAPVLDELADEYKGKVLILKMNVDENQTTPQQFQVMSIPTVVAFKGGREVERKIGFGGREGYIELLEKVLKHKSIKA